MTFGFYMIDLFQNLNFFLLQSFKSIDSFCIFLSHQVTLPNAPFPINVKMLNEFISILSSLFGRFSILFEEIIRKSSIYYDLKIKRNKTKKKNKFLLLKFRLWIKYCVRILWNKNFKTKNINKQNSKFSKISKTQKSKITKSFRSFYLCF